MNATETLVPITREQILKIFEDAKEQTDYIICLMKHAFPDWDRIVKLNGHPRANSETCNFICRKAIEWDRQNTRNVMHGGAWLNWGYSVDDTIPPWFIRPCEVTYAKGN